MRRASRTSIAVMRACASDDMTNSANTQPVGAKSSTNWPVPDNSRGSSLRSTLAPTRLIAPHLPGRCSLCRPFLIELRLVGLDVMTLGVLGVEPPLLGVVLRLIAAHLAPAHESTEEVLGSALFSTPPASLTAVDP